MDGLLGDFLSWVDTKKRNAANTVRGLLADPTQELAQMGSYAMDPLTRMREASQGWLIGAQETPEKAAARAAMFNASMESGLLAPLAIKAFHGSPHIFDKFSMSKIGTGEGAQAYGHGLYFAENPNVAREYAPQPINITPTRPIQEAEQDAWSKLYSTMIQQGGDVSASVRSLENQRRIWERKSTQTPMDADAAKWQLPRIEQAIAMLKGGAAKSVKAEGFYEVNLRWPDAAREARDPLGPKHFLDWDKPLSEQPQAVQDAIEKTGLAFRDTKQAWVEPRGNKFHVVVDGQVERHLFNTKDAAEQFAKQVSTEPQWYAAGRTGSMANGESFYRYAGGTRKLFDKSGWEQQDKVASELLSSLGIPGIRYLDAGSRNKTDWIAKHPRGGENVFPNESAARAYVARNPEYKIIPPEQTANYVVFDDALIEILKRNGLPVGGLLSP